LVSIVLIGHGFGVEGDLMAYMTRRIFGMRAYRRDLRVCSALSHRRHRAGRPDWACRST